MGRPDKGNKAQTPVGYSHGTGVSTGGPATAILGVVARDTPGVQGVVRGYGVTAPPGSVTRGCGDGLQAPGAATKRRCVRKRI